MLFVLFIFFDYSLAKCPLNGLQSPTDKNKCYYFSSSQLDFFKAECACEDYGSYLASICNGFENGFLADNAADHLQQFGVKDVWIGWNDLVNKGRWNWSNPNVNCTSYMNWANGNPRSGDCVSLSISNGKWQTFECSTSKAFIYEQFFEPKQPQCPDGYNYYPIWNTCYKLVKTGYAWQDAENNCVNEGEHLVSIHSNDENEFVDDF